MGIGIKIRKVKEVGKLNTFYISTELEIGGIVRNHAFAYLTNAPEEGFKDLLNSYLSNKEFNSDLFMSYVAKNGYYCAESGEKVFTPSD